MRKIILFTAAILVAFITNAQFDIRVSGGINMLSLTNDYDGSTNFDGQDYKVEAKARGGYNLGGSITFGKNLYISPGIYWTTINLNVVTESTDPNDVKSYENSPKVNTISVPLHIGLRFIDPTKENFINARLFVGVTGHHVISVKDDGYTYTSTNGKQVNVIHQKDDYESMITTFDMGLGIDVGPVFADAGYKIGLSPLFDEPGNNVTANMFYINIGLRIGFFSEGNTVSSF